MSDTRIFTDGELTAYLDGEADVVLRAEIEAARAQDDALGQRLDELRVDRTALQGAFDEMLAQSPPLPDVLEQPRSVETSPGRSFAALKWAACAAGLVIGGAVLGWTLSRAPAESWQSAAATYHALYVNETLASVETKPDQRQIQLQRVSDALGRQISEDGLVGIEGLAYKRAQVLGYQGKPLIQLAFLSSDGVPVALCITPVSKGAEQRDAMQSQRLSGLHAIEWENGGFAFLLLGDTDPARMQAFAQHLRSSI